MSQTTPAARTSGGGRTRRRPGYAAAQGPLAEYSALRTEVLQLSQQMSNLFALHVGAAGSILSVSLASPDGRYVAMVLPVVSYLLCARYFYLHEGIMHIARYIRQELSPRVPGGLGWESWLGKNVRTPGRRIGQGLANLVTFVGIPLLAWGLATPAIVIGNGSTRVRGLRLTAWAVSLAFIVMTVLVLRRSRRIHSPGG